MLHVFILILLASTCVWLFRQISGFTPPIPQFVIILLFILLVAVFAWVWSGTPAIVVR